MVDVTDNENPTDTTQPAANPGTPAANTSAPEENSKSAALLANLSTEERAKFDAMFDAMSDEKKSEFIGVLTKFDAMSDEEKREFIGVVTTEQTLTEAGKTEEAGVYSKIRQQWDNFKSYIDINQDGALHFDDAKAAADNAGEFITENLKKAGEIFTKGGDEEKGGLAGLWGDFKENPSNFLMMGMGALLFGLLFGGESMIGIVIAAVLGAALMGGLGMFWNQKDEPEANAPAITQERERGRGQEISIEHELDRALEIKKDDAGNIQEQGNVLNKNEFDRLLRMEELQRLAADPSASPATQQTVTMNQNQVMLTPERQGMNIGPIILATKNEDNTLSNIQVRMKEGDKDIYIQVQPPIDGQYTSADGTAILSAARTLAADPNNHVNEDTRNGPNFTVDDLSAQVFNVVRPAAAPANGRY